MPLTRRTLGIALPVATLLLAASAGSVSAECSQQPDPFPRMSYAFTAQVTEVSDRVAPGLPDMSAFDWHVELEVERSYRGEVPDRLEANGWEVGCSFTGIEVKTGERLFIAAESMDFNDPRLVSGSVLLWRGIGGGRWEFYADALQDGALTYPTAAVRADSTDEILAVLRDLPAPNTSVADPSPQRERDLPLPLLAAVLVGVISGVLFRPWSRSDASRPRDD